MFYATQLCSAPQEAQLSTHSGIPKKGVCEATLLQAQTLIPAAKNVKPTTGTTAKFYGQDGSSIPGNHILNEADPDHAPRIGLLIVMVGRSIQRSIGYGIFRASADASRHVIQPLRQGKAKLLS